MNKNCQIKKNYQKFLINKIMEETVENHSMILIEHTAK